MPRSYSLSERPCLPVKCLERIDFECERPEIAAQVRAIAGVASVASTGGGYRVELSEEAVVRTVLNFLVGFGVTLIRTSRPSLEEVYVHIIGERGLEKRAAGSGSL